MILRRKPKAANSEERRQIREVKQRLTKVEHRLGFVENQVRVIKREPA